MAEPTRRDVLKLVCLAGAYAGSVPVAEAAAARQRAEPPTAPVRLVLDRMTDRARRVMALAEKEARRLRHSAVRPEDLLLGLAKEGQGIAGYVLRDLGAGYGDLKRVLGSPNGTGRTEPASSFVPFSPLTKAVLDWSWQECKALRHGYIGTEHLILGLTRLSNGPAVNALSALDVNPGAVRRGVLDILGYSIQQAGAAERAGM